MIYLIFLSSIFLFSFIIFALKVHKFKRAEKLTIIAKKNKPKSFTNEIVELKKTYPDYVHLPLKANMDWMRILHKVRDKNKLLLRKAKEADLGNFKN